MRIPIGWHKMTSIHLAILDEFNVVQNIVVGSLLLFETEAFGPKEQVIRYCPETSGNKHRRGLTPFRKNRADIGFTYDRYRDAFIPPRPYGKWILNEETCLWEPPVPMPTTDESWYWDDIDGSWKIDGSIYHEDD